MIKCFVVLLWLATYAVAQEVTYSSDVGITAFSTGAASSAVVPGDTVDADFYNASSQPVTLPSEGRYLLWVLDVVNATDERAEIPVAEYDQYAAEDTVLENAVVNSLPEFTNMTPGYVLFFERLGTLPYDDETRETLQTRLSPLTVLFDDDTALPTTLSSSLFRSTYLDGLYLMEGSKVAYRFLSPSLWDQWGLTDLVKEDVRQFLAGEEPSVVPIVTAPGTPVAEAALPVAGPALLITLDGAEADAPSGGLRVKIVSTPDGGEETSVEGAAPGSQTRFFLDALPPLLGRYGVQGVGVVRGSGDTLPALQAAFPSWQFIAADSPEDRLRWLELRNLVVDASGNVEDGFIMFASLKDDSDSAALERALKDAFQ